MKAALSAAAILLLLGSPALAHRLDEYLQGTIISVEKDRVNAQITLTPGVAVFPLLVAQIDTDRNEVISLIEQRAYASRILRDLSLKIDGQLLKLEVLSMQFPAIEEMKEGRGEILIEVTANLPPGGANRKLIFENYHQSRFAAYQVNCLVPRDPNIRVIAQHRNYSQSFYELDFVEASATSGIEKSLATISLLLIGLLAYCGENVFLPVKCGNERDFVSILLILLFLG